MPKFTYTAAKGIEQSSGSGFIVADVPVIEDSESLTYSASSQDVATYGLTLFTTTADGNTTGTLADGSYTGQQKIMIFETKVTSNVVISPVSSNILTVAGTAVSSLTFDAAGESCLLVWNGSKWNILAASCTVA
jgi:hypothetical protein